MNNFKCKPTDDVWKSIGSPSLGYKNLNILIKLNQFLFSYCRGGSRG